MIKKYKIVLKYDTLEVDKEESLDDAIVNYVGGLVRGYGGYLGFEERR